MLLGNRRALSLFIIRSLSRNSVFVDRRMNVFCAINTSRKTHPWLTLCHKYIRTQTHSYFHSSHKYKHVQLHTNTALYLYIDLARICIYVHQFIFYTYFIKTLLFNIGLWIYPTNAQIQLCIWSVCLHEREISSQRLGFLSNAQ